jgi:alcohol dehydrogenase (cytochrome c)/quinohemoprotein ethanol dehydrogenase
VNWASGVDLETGRPIENPKARFDRTGEGYLVAPGPGGAHSWNPMAYSPETGLVYIPAMESTFPYVTDPNFEISPVAFNSAVDFGALAAEVGRQPSDIRGRDEGFLLAWDPVAGKEVWRRSFLRRRAGGALATGGGLVFAGSTWYDEEFAAYDALTGQELWTHPVQTGIVAGPVSFEVDGVQHVAVVAGANPNDYYRDNNSRLLVYKLDGAAELPERAPEPPRRPLDPPPNTAAAEVVAAGREIYGRTCSTCHGTDGQSRGVFPDLRFSAALQNAEIFKAIVLDGVLAQNGMASFAEALDEADAEAVRAYVIATANALKGP